MEEKELQIPENDFIIPGLGEIVQIFVYSNLEQKNAP